VTTYRECEAPPCYNHPRRASCTRTAISSSPDAHTAEVSSSFLYRIVPPNALSVCLFSYNYVDSSFKPRKAECYPSLYDTRRDLSQGSLLGVSTRACVKASSLYPSWDLLMLFIPTCISIFQSITFRYTVYNELSTINIFFCLIFNPFFIVSVHLMTGK